MVSALNDKISFFQHVALKGIVKHFGRYAYSLSSRELDEKIDSTSLYGKYEGTASV